MDISKEGGGLFLGVEEQRTRHHSEMGCAKNYSPLSDSRIIQSGSRNTVRGANGNLECGEVYRASQENNQRKKN